jgi:cytochrome c oxidase cbb3-type subunit 3
MKNLWIFGIVLIIVLIAGTYAVAGHMIGDDIVNMLAMVGAGAIIVISVVVIMAYVKQMKDATATGDLVDENWDGIGEYNNLAPFGWAISTILLMIWGMWYMTLGYPLNEYSQLGEYNEDSAKANAKMKEHFDTMTDTQKLKMGEGIFAVQCSPCHGPQGNGQENYSTGQLTAEDLTKRKMSKTYVEKVIREGSTQLGYAGGMPPFLLQDDAEIATVSAYVANGFKEEDIAGKDLFTAACASCHGGALAEGIKGYKSWGVKPDEDTTGVEGYSNPCVGEDCIGRGQSGVAPSLKGYNSCLVNNLLRHGMKKGEIGVMPAFGEMLTIPQIEAVSAYVAHGTDKEIEE